MGKRRCGGGGAPPEPTDLGGPMASRADERKICRKQCGGWRCFVQLVFESVSPAGENGRSLRACEKTAKNCMKTA